MAVYTCNPRTWEVGRSAWEEDQEFKASLDSIASLRPAWATTL